MKSNVTENDIKKSCDNFQRILYYAIKMSNEESQFWVYSHYQIYENGIRIYMLKLNGELVGQNQPYDKIKNYIVEHEKILTFPVVEK
jgi:hypothetical protein